MRVADPLELPRLQDAQQLRLQRRAHRPDLIQEERAAVRLFEPSLPRRDRAGEGAPDVPEQLRFEQRLRDRAAVDRDEALRSPRAVVVNRARRELLAGPGLPRHEDRARGLRDGLEELEEIAHDAALAHQAIEPVALFELRAEVRILRPEPPLLYSGVNDVQQRVELKRLGDEVGRPLLDGFDRVLHRAVAGHDDRDDVRVAIQRRLNDGSTVHPRKPQIGDENVEREVREPGDRLFAVRRLHDLESRRHQPFGDRLPQRAFVVHKQQMFRCLSHLVARPVF